MGKICHEDHGLALRGLFVTILFSSVFAQKAVLIWSTVSRIHMI